MIHKLFYQGRIHGWNLLNVRVACRATVKQAQPVDRREALAVRDGLCESCDATATPRDYKTLFVKEAQENHAPAQTAAA